MITKNKLIIEIKSVEMEIENFSDELRAAEEYLASLREDLAHGNYDEE